MPNVTRALSSASSFGATRSTSADGRGSVHTRVTPPGAVFGGVPARRRVSAHGPFAHVAIMQIGDPQVPILGAIAGKIATRTEPRLADEFEPRLKGVAHIGIEAMNGGAPIDEENSEGADALRLAVRRRCS